MYSKSLGVYIYNIFKVIKLKQIRFAYYIKSLLLNKILLYALKEILVLR